MTDNPARAIQHFDNDPSAVISLKAGAVALQAALGPITLPAPTAGNDDGNILAIIDRVGFPFVVEVVGAGINGVFNTAKFDGNQGSSIRLIACQGAWFVLTKIGVFFT
jgi:hypothetical protein